jgi:hypothetical protein
MPRRLSCETVNSLASAIALMIHSQGSRFEHGSYHHREMDELAVEAHNEIVLRLAPLIGQEPVLDDPWPGPEIPAELLHGDGGPLK